MLIGKLNTQFEGLPLDEKANVITHGFGLILMVLLTPILLMSEPFSVKFWGLSAFAFGMIFMLGSSTVYHLMDIPTKKNIWRIIDHIAIFILIGCTYTPFILFYYNTPTGIKFLEIHWLIITGGIIFKLIFKDKYELFSLSLYLILGWMVLFIYGPITENMNPSVLFWLLAGGFFYTIGVIFYTWTKLVWHHAIWHIFVILGCLGHYTALYLS